MNLKSSREAFEKGRSILKKLKQPQGWKIRVWENMDWHVALHKGGMSLYPSCYDNKTEKYSVLFNEHGDQTGGAIFWTNNFFDKDPNKVIAHQLKQAQAFVHQCQKAIDEVGK